MILSTQAVLGPGVYVTRCHPHLMSRGQIAWNNYCSARRVARVARVIPLAVRRDQVVWAQSAVRSIGKLRNSERGWRLTQPVVTF